MRWERGINAGEWTDKTGGLCLLGESGIGLGPVLTGVGALYLTLAVFLAMTEPAFRSPLFMLLASVTTGVFFGSRLTVTRYPLSPIRAESLGTIFATLVVLNGVAHFYFVSGSQQTVGLALLSIGLTCFFLFYRVLITILAVSLVMWMVLELAAHTTPSWLNFAFGLFAATGLKLYVSFQKARLDALSASAQGELERRIEAEQALKESEERFSLAAIGSKDGLWDWDIKNDLVYYSHRWKTMLGYDEDEIGQRLTDWFSRVHHEDLGDLQDAFSYHLEGKSKILEAEFRIRRRNGRFSWVLARGLAIRGEDGRLTRVAGSQTDIHKRKLAEKKLYQEAFYDPVTGLGNRMLFTERLQLALARAKRQPEYGFAVLFLDLDRFKVVNDSLGRLSGDQLLRMVAQKLEATLRQVDAISRFAGDEFAIFVDEVNDSEAAEICADRIHECLREPFSLGNREVFLSASIGIVLSSKGYSKPEEILRDADIAMYRAKVKNRSSSQIFEKEMHVEAMAAWQLENDLRVGLRDRQFRMWYQPIVDVRNNRISGCEALIRWKHPRRGLLAPGQFLKAVDDAGMLVALGWWAVEEACRTSRLWQQSFPSNNPVSVSVNLAAAQFARGDAFERVQGILERTKLNPASLKLEITEDSVKEIGEAVSILTNLRELGIELHLDDFGTGYSSLSYLHRLPLSVAKIDRSLLKESERIQGNRRAFGAVINLIHELEMEVTVEGVESENQWTLAESLGCEYIQGFYYSKPLAPESLWKLFRRMDDFRFELEATG
jgi:diguanylate cyclase (GGDEF)-like protein/PAS domain S-box-containing protein